jgi:hypothetical protein
MVCISISFYLTCLCSVSEQLAGGAEKLLNMAAVHLSEAVFSFLLPFLCVMLASVRHVRVCVSGLLSHMAMMLVSSCARS